MRTVATEIKEEIKLKKKMMKKSKETHEMEQAAPDEDNNVDNETQTDEQASKQIESNPVFSRVFIQNPNFGGTVDSSTQFSIVSYNVLADCHLFRNDYSFTHPDHLAPEYRLNKLIEEIQFLDADIVCLQEVEPDFFKDRLLPHMKGHGYEGFHKKRKEDYFDEGEATFYRTSRFTLVDVSLHRVADLVEKELVEGMDPSMEAAVRQYMDRPDVLVITRLQCNNSGQQITVGNIHVTWGEMKVPDVQSLQIACAIKEIVRKAGAEAYPHVICGDFNSEPFSPGYLMAKDGYLNDEGTINKLQQLQNLKFPDGRTEALVNCLRSGFKHTSTSLKSVYFETLGAEPEITSYNRGMCACVDYQFYSSSSLDAIGVLQTASKDRIMETGGTPNIFFPSDHVSMKAVFSFK